MGRFMIFCCGLLSVVILGATNDTVNRTHIYSTYPTHVTADQLVCLHRDCTSDDDECVTSYDVCSENPAYENQTVIGYVCHAGFFVDSNTSFTTTSQQCLNDPHSYCSVNCTFTEFALSDVSTIYDCCCTGNLCNDVEVELNGTDENANDTSPTVISTPTITLPNATTVVLFDATTTIPSATRLLPNATTTLPSATTVLPNGTAEVPNATTSSLTPTAAPSAVTTTLPTTTPGPTNVNTHIYSTYPTHVAPDELVCIYHNCTDGDCDTQYEVCSENPAYKNVSTVRYTCYAVFVVNADTGDITTSQHCFNDPHSICPAKCTPTFEVSTDIVSVYGCCCVGNLCNDVSLNVTALPSTSSVVDHVTTTPITGPDSTVRATSVDDDDDESEYVPLIYGIAAGVCLMIILTLVVILTLAYCHYYRDRHVNCRKCISYNHFGS